MGDNNLDFSDINNTDYPKGYDEIMEECRRMTKSKVSEVVSLNAPFLGSVEGRAMLEDQLYGVLLQMFSYVQANMLVNRKEKQRRGIAAAKAAGVRLGRKQKYNAEDYIDVYKRLACGEITFDEAMAYVGACRTTFVKMQRELEEKRLI